MYLTNLVKNQARELKKEVIVLTMIFLTNHVSKFYGYSDQGKNLFKKPLLSVGFFGFSN